MNESVVECRLDVADTKCVSRVLLVWVHLRWSEVGGLLFLLLRLLRLSLGLNTHKHTN